MLVFGLLKGNIHFRALAIVILAGKVNSKSCDGGHACYPPKECCTLGCCYLYATSGYRPTISQGGQNSNLLNLVVWNHWVFWCLLLLSFLSCMGGCGLWRRRQISFGRWWCCRDNRSDEERSEPDSAGSCYPPPHYSRCSSFHHAPPPYTEVTSKPDLYPLVISYGAENGKIGDNYLMVQYFRNYIVRPALGSLSAESTADSISSSFLCQSANETDSNIPPPYEDSTQDDRDDLELETLTRSASSVSHSSRILSQVQPQSIINNSRRESCTITIGNNERAQTGEMQQIVTDTIHQSIHKASAAITGPPRLQSMLPNTFQSFRTFPNSFANNHHLYSEPTPNHQSSNRPSNEYLTTFKRVNRSVILSTSVDSIHERNGYPTHRYTSDVILAQPQSYCDPELHYYSTDIINNPNRLLKYVNDSFSSEDNLSQPRGSLQDFVSSDGLSHSQPSNLEINHYSTSSDISSLQGCGTPDSPPQATSPTGEFRDLLDKIQQLPGHHRESNRSLDLDTYCSYNRRYHEDEVPSCSADDSLLEGTSTSANYSAHNDNETNEESFLLTDSLLSDVDSNSRSTKPKNLMPVRPNKLLFKKNFPSRSKTFYMPFCHNTIGRTKKKNSGNFSFSAPVTPVTGFPSPNSIAVNFLANPRKLGSRKSLERNVDDSSPLLQDGNGNSDEIF